MLFIHGFRVWFERYLFGKNENQIKLEAGFEEFKSKLRAILQKD